MLCLLKIMGKLPCTGCRKESLTIKVTLNPGHHMNYHSHEFRDEVWNVISGEGRIVIDDVIQNVKAGDTVKMKAGCKHTVLADTELQIIEVQFGKILMYATSINIIFILNEKPSAL